MISVTKIRFFLLWDLPVKIYIKKKAALKRIAKSIIQINLNWIQKILIKVVEWFYPSFLGSADGEYDDVVINLINNNHHHHKK